MKIVAHYDPPPIPVRDMDWTAVDDDTYDGPGCPIGHGATEAEAVADFLIELELRDAKPENRRRHPDTPGRPCPT